MRDRNVHTQDPNINTNIWFQAVATFKNNIIIMLWYTVWCEASAHCCETIMLSKLLLPKGNIVF